MSERLLELYEELKEKDAEIARLKGQIAYGWEVAGYKPTDGVAVDKPHKFGSYIAEMMAGKDAENQDLRELAASYVEALVTLRAETEGLREAVADLRKQLGPSIRCDYRTETAPALRGEEK